MDNSQRKITIYTPEKIYRGSIDIANGSLRTIDIFNSANVYWKDPNEKSFNDAMLLNNASIALEGNIKLGDFPKLQVRLSEVLFFHDSLENLGDSMEKKRAVYLNLKTKESKSTVHIITQTRGNSFFYISGTFHGLFKSKSNHRYIPITQAGITQMIRSNEKWQKKTILIEGGFVGISTAHIEACNFSQA
ncbi:MAG: hypothetical protein VR65_04930 [Desulfobulbaceae bacterium BRH_c16a]|nr:MAG: hypothetical protein VR65_04930 [Desulfobulbaceae bacterium BRH_c16a]